jgi:hypothetical protein
MPGSTLGKLLLVILAAALTAAGLLVARQRRLDTAHEMSRAHQRIVEHERALWQLRLEIAERCRPEAVRDMIDALGGEWATIPRFADDGWEQAAMLPPAPPAAPDAPWEVR